MKPVFAWKQYYPRLAIAWVALWTAARFFTDPLLADGTSHFIRSGLAFVIAYPLMRWIVRREHYTHTPEGDHDA